MDIISVYHQIGYAGVALIICAVLAVYIGLKTFIYLSMERV